MTDKEKIIEILDKAKVEFNNTRSGHIELSNGITFYFTATDELTEIE